jgi:bla regulator protein blaR1
MTLAAIGWTVAQSLWQWTIVAGAAAWLFGVLRGRPASTRYVIGCAALAAMMVVALVTAGMTVLAIDVPFRFRTLYAFGGALIVPGLSAHGRTILQLIGVIWVIGVVGGLVRLMMEWRRVRRLRRTFLTDLDREALRAMNGLREGMGITRTVSVHHSPLAHVPMVLGWRRPTVLLPADSATLLTAGQQLGIVAHEFGHIRRGDVLANAVLVLIDVVAFYHPAARWVSRRIRAEREYACDDMAIAVTHDVHGYARGLAALEDARADCRLVVAAASGTLLDRVQRLAGRQRVRLDALRGALACAIALIVAVVLWAVTMNVPPPWMPSGVRLRRPNPVPQSKVPGFQSSRVPKFEGSAVQASELQNLEPWNLGTLEPYSARSASRALTRVALNAGT